MKNEEKHESSLAEWDWYALMQGHWCRFKISLSWRCEEISDVADDVRDEISDPIYKKNHRKMHMF